MAVAPEKTDASWPVTCLSTTSAPIPSSNEGTQTLMSSASHPSTHSSFIRSKHIGSVDRFCTWTSRKTFSLSMRDIKAVGDLGICTLVLTDNGLVTCAEQLSTVHLSRIVETYCEFVVLSEDPQVRSIRVFRRPSVMRVSQRVWEQVADRTCEHVLVQLSSFDQSHQTRVERQKSARTSLISCAMTPSRASSGSNVFSRPPYSASGIFVVAVWISTFKCTPETSTSHSLLMQNALEKTSPSEIAPKVDGNVTSSESEKSRSVFG